MFLFQTAAEEARKKGDNDLAELIDNFQVRMSKKISFFLVQIRIKIAHAGPSGIHFEDIIKFSNF